jgi:hypothetical protein
MVSLPQILPVMLVASLSLVLLRAAVLTYQLFTEMDDTGRGRGGKGRMVSIGYIYIYYGYLSIYPR